VSKFCGNSDLADADNLEAVASDDEKLGKLGPKALIPRYLLVGCDGDQIEYRHLPAGIFGARQPRRNKPSGDVAVVAASTHDEQMHSFERDRVTRALESCGGNQTKAAELLGIPRRTLVSKLAALGLSRGRYCHRTSWCRPGWSCCATI
jgi:hypothetical protein